MATIDGVTFHLTSFQPIGYIKNTQAQPPGTDSNPNTDLGSGHMVVSLSGVERTRTLYDAVMAAFLADGVHELVLDTGWKFYVQRGNYQHPRRIAPSQNWFSYTFTLILEDNYIYSTTETTRTRTLYESGSWSTDNDSNTITTSGNVYSKPTIVLDSSVEDEVLLDDEDTILCTSSTSYIKLYEITFDATPNKTRKLESVEFNAKSLTADIFYYKITVTAASYNGGVETTVVEDSMTTEAWAGDYTVRNYDASGDDILSGVNEAVTIKYYYKVTSYNTCVEYAKATCSTVLNYGLSGNTLDIQDSTYKALDSTSYVLTHTHTFTAIEGKSWKLNSVYFEADTNDTVDRIVYYKVTVTAASYNGGVETTVVESTFRANTNVPNDKITYDASGDSIVAGNNENMVIKYYFHDSADYTYIVRVYDTLSTAEEQLISVVDDVTLYNAADSSIICNVCGRINPDTIISINPNGTGTYDYSDDLTDNKALYHCFAYSGVTFDTDHLSIADDGYIYYRIETYYPITGTPVLTSTIDITSGTPTIQIADDNSGAPGTFYDIDTVIVDNISTDYLLVSGEDVKLPGKTIFWLRFDCTGTGTVTADIYDIDLSISMITLDAQIPKIYPGGANTFTIAHTGSYVASFDISLQYEARKWA